MGRFIAVIAIVVVVSVLGVVGTNDAPISENQYTKSGIVQEIDGNVVRVLLNNGEMWSFYGEDYEAGQEVTCIFDDMGTRTDTWDDELVDVK